MTDTAEFDCVNANLDQGGGSGGGGGDNGDGFRAKAMLLTPNEGNRRTIHSSNFNLSFMQLYSINLMHPNNIGGAIEEDFNKPQQDGKRQTDQTKNEIDIENP